MQLLRDWFRSRSVATQVTCSVTFDAVQIVKGDEPTEMLDCTHKIVGIITSLGVLTWVGDKNRKFVRVSI